ncbi:MAG: glycosyltransferase family 1 protein [Bacteroidota bacterium]
MSKSKLNIAFDAKRLYNNFTGLGNYSRTLVKSLVQYFPDYQYHLYTPKLKHNGETRPFLEYSQLQTHLPKTAFKNYWRTSSIKKDLQKASIDIYHGLSHEIPIGIQKTNIKSIVTIHDLIIKRYPQYFPWLDRQIYDWKFRYACENADIVVAISESTKRDIMEFYEIPAEKIQVIYQTCHERFKRLLSIQELKIIAQKYQLPSHFYLYVGSIIPRKNLDKIVNALSLLPKGLQLPLVVIGNGKKYKQQVLEKVKKHQLEDKIRFLTITYEDLPAFYQLASLFLYPSAYEGFGLPILEALYSRTPVVSAKTSSLTEAGGSGAYYVERIDGEQLSDAIEKVMNDSVYQQQLIDAGQVHLIKFESRKLSSALMKLYQNLISTRT